MNLFPEKKNFSAVKKLLHPGLAGLLSLAFVLAWLTPSPCLRAGDWPTFRHDATRSGATKDAVRPPLFLEWTLKPLHPPRPAWPPPSEEEPRMHDDNVFAVTVAGGTAFFGSSAGDRIYAVDIAAGRILWTFCAGGPVRFAPAADSGRVYFGSDDGYAYCLRARDGSLLWKKRPGPGSGTAIGSGRVISTWPVRTSILVDGGRVYLGAGVFPYEGIVICCLDAATGAVIWKNDTIGDRAHELEFGGISPMGYLAASKDVLFVPSGRAMPAAFDRATGRFLYYASPGAKRGGTFALVEDDSLIAGRDLSGSPQKVVYDAKTGGRRGAAYAWYPGIDMVVTKETTYILTREGIYAVDRKAYAAAVAAANAAAAKEKKLRAFLASSRKKRAAAKGKEAAKLDAAMDETAKKILALREDERRARESSRLWRCPAEKMRVLAVAKDAVFAGGDGRVIAVDRKTGRLAWKAGIAGRAFALAPAGGRLLVSTGEGPIYCFGKGGAGKPRTIAAETVADPYEEDDLTPLYEKAAESIAAESGIRRGFCLVLDCGEGRLAFELAKRTDLTILGLETDPDKLTAARDAIERAGLYGVRVAVEPWRIEDLPPYFANLIVSDPWARRGRGGKGSADEGIMRVLRPCGGTLLSRAPAEDTGSPGAAGGDSPGSSGTAGGAAMKWARFVRGPLEGAGSWTQLYANPANTACSMDERVKGPFGVLWYGEPGPKEIVDRHGRSTAPLSMDGRLFHQGAETVMAYDAYNGSFLWKRNIPGAVRVRADVDGGNLALSKEALFVAAHDKCFRLDPATGETVRTFTVPAAPGGPFRWGFVSACEGLLFGTAAKPLKMEYAAAWKDFVDRQKGTWKAKDAIPESERALWADNVRYKKLYDDSKTRHPRPDEDLYMELHRNGVLWQPMNDFPSWDSQRTPRGALTGRLMAAGALFAMDPDTGEVVWERAGNRIPNISITIAEGTLYYVEECAAGKERAAALAEKDTLSAEGIYEEGAEARLVKAKERDVRIVAALDARTGRVRWRKPLDVTGCGGDKMGTAFAKGVLLLFGHFSNHDTRFFLNKELTWRRITALDAATGEVLWSRPLNYLRRPLVVGDTIIIEPRACDLKTGRIKTRPHPISGRPVPWEFLRPGHCCSITSASAHMLFYRSYWGAMYDMTDDKGISLFGAIRPGCWLNMISAGGLMLMPEASSGCTCSFPLRCSVALVPKPEKKADNWTIFVTHGPDKPVKHLAVNFGAPGDMRDEQGMLWLAWPRPRAVSNIGYGNYGMRFDLKAEIAPGPGRGYFRRDYRCTAIPGTDAPWLFVSGCRGIARLTVPLIDADLGQPPGRYTVRLGFAADPGEKKGTRVFDVSIQEKTVLRRFDMIKAAGGSGRAVTQEFKGIPVKDRLTVTFTPSGKSGAGTKPPLVNWIEILREDVENLPLEARGADTDSGARSLPAEAASGSAETLLAEAASLEREKNANDALDLYHTLFTGDFPKKAKIEALEGMKRIAAPRSLAFIEDFWRNRSSILTGYRPADPALLAGTVEFCLALSKKLGRTDPSRARKAIEGLAGVLPFLKDDDLRAKAASALGIVLKWRLAGPIPWGEGRNSIAAVFEAARPVDPVKPVKIGEKVYSWKKWTGRSERIDLERAIGPRDRVFAYAAASFTLDRGRDLVIALGSDDGFKCWLNGKEIGGFDGPRSWRAGETVLKAKGRKGENTLLLEIIDQAGDWAFSARVTDERGTSALTIAPHDDF